jgi:hypothetical protein
MRVNSAFNGFFTNRSVPGPGIAIVMLAIFFTASSFNEHPGRDLRAKQVNLIIRQIGHQLLLQAGDSTSRVLPVTEAKAGTFQLRFENEFVFSHDSLMVLVQGLLPKIEFPSGYIVTVLECDKADIVYGFKVSNIAPDILACRGRSEPSGCYTIEFTFPDFYKNVEPENVELKKVEQKKADIHQPAEEIKSINPLMEELKSAKVDPLPAEAHFNFEEIKPATFDYPLIYSGMLLLLGVALLIERFGKTSAPLPVQHQNQPIIKEKPVAELAALGKFLFDVKDQRLLLGSEVISLTDKECKVLELLHNNFGELIPRETLMQKIWINEGVITGRSLDVFVSKLRKKLSSDPELRITNLHGKGYKLEII